MSQIPDSELYLLPSQQLVNLQPCQPPLRLKVLSLRHRPQRREALAEGLHKFPFGLGFVPSFCCFRRHRSIKLQK